MLPWTVSERKVYICLFLSVLKNSKNSGPVYNSVQKRLYKGPHKCLRPMMNAANMRSQNTSGPDAPWNFNPHASNSIGPAVAFNIRTTHIAETGR